MTDRSELVLGIDAGNTKTIALISDTSGTVLGWGRAGSSNIYVSKPRALLALDQAVQAARSRAGLNGSSFAAVTLSSAGADWPEDFLLLQTMLEERGWAERVQVVNDAVGALRAGTLEGIGVAVACGTSAGVAARSPGGAVWHSSYWQEPEGADELAKFTLRAAYRAELGIDPPTSLTARVLAHYHQESVGALLHSLTRRDRRPPRRLGRLARLLLDEAEAGDETSLKIVCKHGRSLGDYALAAARRVDLGGSYTLVTSGGVMRHPSRVMIRALMERVQATHPEARWQASRHEPVFGALLLALELARHPVQAALLERLEATCPDESVFRT
ncbi:BadF/BadG/BcrA/BcrD ATPase family protein [Deinococcus sp.]|uniref:BadF/BadG/BcrA/BcrD ATPase family protein n=1 Tax=Deinococcus sp. TaxID=47478 RepID=UPI003C7BD85F